MSTNSMTPQLGEGAAIRMPATAVALLLSLLIGGHRMIGLLLLVIVAIVLVAETGGSDL